MELTISGKDKKQLKKVEDLAKELGLKIKRKRSIFEKEEKENPGKRNELMPKKTAEGGITSFEDPGKAIEALKNLRETSIFSDIDDPVEWQREIRKDRNIGRNG